MTRTITAARLRTITTGIVHTGLPGSSVVDDLKEDLGSFFGLPRGVSTLQLGWMPGVAAEWLRRAGVAEEWFEGGHRPEVAQAADVEVPWPAAADWPELARREEEVGETWRREVWISAAIWAQ